MNAARATRRLLAQLLLGAACMFAFAIFVMPPLYDLFCEVTGIGGRTQGQYTAAPSAIDTSREVTVKFVATNNESMPWDFRPMEFSVVVHPGEQREVRFFARNTTDSNMVAQAIPNLVPGNAVDYFHKTECFCFNSQPLAAGEQAEMPLIFIVDPDLPRSVNTLTMSYTLFDVTEQMADQLAQVN